MNKRSLTTLLEELHHAASDIHQFDRTIAEIMEDYGNDGLEAMLVVPELPEGADDAMWSLLHAVESRPNPQYVDALVRHAPAMTTLCPARLKLLALRVMNTADCAGLFIPRLSALTPDAREYLAAVFAEGEQQPDRSELGRENCRLALRQLEAAQ